MTTTIRPVRVNHMNIIWEDFDASVAHVQKLYGATIVMDIPPTTMHPGLFEVGRVLFEFFCPLEYLPISRYGPHFVGIEYQADMTVVRAAIAERGMRIIRDTGIALHTDPADGFGVSLEFFDGQFHDMNWEEQGGTSLRSAAYWREHPLGAVGQKAYTVAVHDIDAASAFFQSFLGAKIVYDVARPAVAARAVGLQIADVVMELLTPVGSGTIQAYLRDHGQGIFSTVFAVRDIEQARRYFTERGVALEPGTAPEAFAIPAKANLGVIFEFSQ
jgi:catechol 2,3-dioxygenase-like lactoylglutathione lyase family enzyme